MNCRHCGAGLDVSFIDLGTAPPSNSYLTAEDLRGPERWFPLRVLVCTTCWLVQTEGTANPIEPFDENYAYFSGFSETWLAHARRYVDDMVERFALGAGSHVVEVASNDGYLLQYFVAKGIPCTGIEPTASTAAAARAKGVPTIQDFFGERLAKELVEQGKCADLMAANNVLAHVPDINGFVRGFAALLAPEGVATFEFPHLARLIEGKQFDTIYYEHYSYLSLVAVNRIFVANGLSVVDVEELPTHGGSLRVFAQRSDTGKRPRSAAVDDVLSREKEAGITSAECYRSFQKQAEKIKNDFLQFLLDAKEEGKAVVGYGAAAKGNTLLNYAGVRGDLVSFVVDRNPAKQGKYLPGSRIPIVDESGLRATKPEYVVIFPWNIRDEVMSQLSYIKEWGGRFVTAVPAIQVTK